MHGQKFPAAHVISPHSTSCTMQMHSIKLTSQPDSKSKRPYIFLALVLMIQTQAHIESCFVQLSCQLVSSCINLHPPGVESAGGCMVCRAGNVLQADKASPVQLVQNLLCKLQTIDTLCPSDACYAFLNMHIRLHCLSRERDGAKLQEAEHLVYW